MISNTQIFGLFFLLALTCSLKISTHQADSPIIVGGFNSINVSALTRQEQKVDEFIKDEQPKLKNATLTNGSVQIVNGRNYDFNYTLITPKGTQYWNVDVYADLEGNLGLTG